MLSVANEWRPYKPGDKGRRLSQIGVLSVEGFLGGIERKGMVNSYLFEVRVEQILASAVSAWQGGHLGPCVVSS